MRDARAAMPQIAQVSKNDGCAIACVQELLLGGNFIGESGCMAMASQLGTLSSLRELDLGSNRISKNACAVLSAIARKNKKLSVLRLEDQNEDDHVGEHDDDEPFYDPAGLLPNYFNIPNLYNVFGDGDGDSELDLDDNLDDKCGAPQHHETDETTVALPLATFQQP